MRGQWRGWRLFFDPAQFAISLAARQHPKSKSMADHNPSTGNDPKQKSAHQDFFDAATLKVLEEVFNQFDKVKFRSS